MFGKYIKTFDVYIDQFAAVQQTVRVKLPAFSFFEISNQGTLYKGKY